MAKSFRIAKTISEKMKTCPYFKGTLVHKNKDSYAVRVNLSKNSNTLQLVAYEEDGILVYPSYTEVEQNNPQEEEIHFLGFWRKQ